MFMDKAEKRIGSEFEALLFSKTKRSGARRERAIYHPFLEVANNYLTME